MTPERSTYPTADGLARQLSRVASAHGRGQDPTLRFRARSDHAADGRVRLEVSNTGPDVPPYDIPMLFEPFRRLDNERLATAKGAGLGLSIVWAIAAAHNGEVTAAPRDGGGLVVHASLPAAPNDGSRVD